MNINSISFNGCWYKLSNHQLNSLSGKNGYLLGVSTGNLQKKNDNWEGHDGLYISIRDKKENEFVKTCKKFRIIPQKVNTESHT